MTKLVSIVFACLVFVACGGEQDDATAGQESNQTAAACTRVEGNPGCQTGYERWNCAIGTVNEMCLNVHNDEDPNASYAILCCASR